MFLKSLPFTAFILHSQKERNKTFYGRSTYQPTCSDFAGIGVIGFLENGKCILLIIGDYAWRD